ncbi:MAG TPA: hypothetical protein VFA18_06360 [Gemmataceae bacterium]|nr:hypothetical protein [Gemmataceae bacterium]
MPILCFDPLDSYESQTVGPAPYFRLEGGSLLQGPHDAEVATFNGGLWTTSKGACITIRATGPVEVRFETEGKSCEGAPSLCCDIRLVDGSIRHGTQGEHLLARLDQATQFWHVYPNHSRCSVAILTDRPWVPESSASLN